jgi:hypothetical protein
LRAECGNPHGIDNCMRPSECRALGPCGGNPGFHAISNQLPLELSNAGEYSEYQPSIRCAGVHSFMQADQVDSQCEWGAAETSPKIKLLSGERHRERVVTLQEEAKYLSAAPEPVASIASVLCDTGLRPEECFRLRWEAITWVNGRNGVLLVTHGKTAAARRVLPMTPRVRDILETRWEASGKPAEGGFGLLQRGAGMSNLRASRNNTPERSGSWRKRQSRRTENRSVHSCCTVFVTLSLSDWASQAATHERWRGLPGTAMFQCPLGMFILLRTRY